MKSINKKNTKKIISIVCLSFLFFFLSTKATHALDLLGIGEFAAGAIASFATLLPKLLLEVLTGILTFVLGLVGYAFANVIDFNLSILNPDLPAYNFISVGWTIMRDIANLGFVLFIIIIALATIVRFREYEAKKLLPRLIGAAILVNFSLAIPSVFINFSDVLSNYFLGKIGVEDSTPGKLEIISNLKTGARLSTKIGNLLSPSLLDSVVNGGDVGETMKDAYLADTPGESIAQLFEKFISLIFVACAIFVFLCLVFLFLFRYVALHFLLMLAPIVWLFWVIPGLNAQFKTWWSKFMQYTFFMPISIFMLYLTIGVGEKLRVIRDQTDMAIFVNDKIEFSSVIQKLIMIQLNGYMLMGFLIGAIIVGQKLSIHGADGAMKVGRNIVDKGKKWAKQGAKAGGDAAMRSERAQKIADDLKKRGRIGGLAGYALQRNINKRLGEKAKKDKQKLDLSTNNDEEKMDYTAHTGNQAGYEFGASGAKDRIKDLENENKNVTQKHDTRLGAEQNLERAERNQKTSEGMLKKEYEKKGATLQQLRDFDMYRSFISGKNRKNFAERPKEEQDFMRTTLGEERMRKYNADIAKAKNEDEKNKIEDELNDDMEARAKIDFMDKMNGVDLGKEYKELNLSEDRLAKAAESLDDAIEAEEKATKTRDRAQEGLNSWERDVIGKLGNSTATLLQQKNYDLSQTDLPGSRKAKLGKKPELSFDKIEKSFEKATKRFEDVKLENEKIKNNPLLTREEKEQSQQKFEMTQRIFIKEKMQFEAYNENHKKEKEIRDAIGERIKMLKERGIKDDGIARDEEVKKARESLYRLRKEKLEIAKKNPYLTTPAYVKEKKKDIDDEKEEKEEK